MKQINVHQVDHINIHHIDYIDVHHVSYVPISNELHNGDGFKIPHQTLVAAVGNAPRHGFVLKKLLFLENIICVHWHTS